MRRERLRNKYPMLYAFGDRIEFLAIEDAMNATVDQRIQSVWPFAVERVLQFHRSLKPREQVNCDPEDILTDLYLMLRENDHLWEPERGKYITYAGRLISHELLAIRDRARTVQSPRNSTSRIKDYKASEKDGSLSDRRRETYDQLTRTVDAVKSMPSTEAFGAIDEDHTEEVAAHDLGEHELKLMAKAIRRLSPVESFVLGWSSGLWGSGYCTHQEIADRLHRDVNDVREIKASAYAKIKWYIRSRTKSAVSEVE
jgi:DNA-directed RNA polymerase sigma subunit (sigma70/sigma32)